MLSVLGTLPVGQGFELFLRGGALFASREYSVGGQAVFLSRGQQQKFASTVWVAGAGATWSFVQRFGIRAEFEQTGALDETIVTGETRLKRISLSALCERYRVRHRLNRWKAGEQPKPAQTVVERNAKYSI